MKQRQHLAVHQSRRPPTNIKGKSYFATSLVSKAATNMLDGKCQVLVVSPCEFEWSLCYLSRNAVEILLIFDVLPVVRFAQRSMQNCLFSLASLSVATPWQSHGSRHRTFSGAALRPCCTHNIFPERSYFGQRDNEGGRCRQALATLACN